MKQYFLSIFFFAATSAISFSHAETNNIRKEFEIRNNNSSWAISFSDDCTTKNNMWFLDGLKGNVSYSEKGMILSAGKTENENASHTVLWTRKEFNGDIKIEYYFTRLDSNKLENNVNILYIHASGSGQGNYCHDISKWIELRNIPAMNIYFDHMNAYHISYAVNHVPYHTDYVRARRYAAETGKGLLNTGLLPEYKNTDLFKPGNPYHIVVIITQERIYMQVSNVNQEEDNYLFHFSIPQGKQLKGGRIGLRQMWTRISRYRDFKVYELEKR